MRLLSRDEMHRLRPAETHAFPGPVPTQIVSSEEYFPLPQSGPQRLTLGPRDPPVPEAMPPKMPTGEQRRRR